MNALPTALVLAGLVLPATAAAQEFSKPILRAWGNAAGCVTISWSDSDMSGVHSFEVLRQGKTTTWVFPVEPPHGHTDCGLEPDTEYRYQVCANYVTEDQDAECESIAARTLPLPASGQPQPPPTPQVVSHDAGDTWIGIKWDAGYNYDSYFINIDENIAPGQTQNIRTLHHDDDGTWGYQRVEGLQPGRTYNFAVQGCTEVFLGILDDHCWGWSSVYSASTLPPPDPRLCISGYVWREVTPEDLVCVDPEERDVNIPNDNAQHSVRSQRRFAPDSCPLTAPKSRKCYVTECIPPFVWRDATPGDKICVPTERAMRVAADNAAAASRQIGNKGP
jgi:hypothetical protein